MNSEPIVLFVDDETSVTSGIRAALRKAPFRVLIANSGAEALELLAEERVDVVVSDERMPGMTGSQLLARVRQEYPDTMRMILSGQADLQAAVRAINEGGIFRFLLKPCPASDLAASVEEALAALARKRRFDLWETEADLSPADPSTAFERALESLSMSFQPILHGRASNAETSLFAFEAIPCVDDPEVADLSQLFGLAEGLGRVADVDALVRRALAARIDEAPGSVQFLLDVHPHSLQDARLYDPEDALARFADRVVLGLTERSSLHANGSLAARVERLRSLGYRIALDDLGAGDSGLEAFSLLQPDVVKLDADLVHELHTCATRALLVESMTAICDEMGILTVAQGIDSRKELEAALAAGCRLLQGRFLGTPSSGFLRASA